MKPPWLPIEAIGWGIRVYRESPSFGTHALLGILVQMIVAEEHGKHVVRMGSCPRCRGGRW